MQLCAALLERIGVYPVFDFAGLGAGKLESVLKSTHLVCFLRDVDLRRGPTLRDSDLRTDSNLPAWLSGLSQHPPAVVRGAAGADWRVPRV